MTNSPIQVVLNTNDFIVDLQTPPGGSLTDFYAGNDVEFVSHKETIQQQLLNIKDLQLTNNYSSISYAKITLEQSALAKSHRPTKALFRKDVAPIVGAGDLGELFVELTPQSIDKVNQCINKAEVETRWKATDDGMPKASPSKYRSELGAIKQIAPYTKEDKRQFSTQQALDWLSDPTSGGAYIVELFDNPPARKDWDTLPKEKYELFKSFVLGLEQLGSGLNALKIKTDESSAILFGIKLEDSETSPIIQLLPTQSSTRNIKNITKTNLDEQKHNRLLLFLDNHPLVRRISLPPKITKSNTTSERVIGQGVSIPECNVENSYPKICIVDGGVSTILGNWIEDKWEFLSPADKNENHGTFIAGLAIMGKQLNQGITENDGCKIIDLDLLPEYNFSTYYNQSIDFFNELEIAVRDLKARTGVRIFNFSLNIEEHASTNGYGIVAQILDRIAEENDVIFVISAGNTRPNEVRKEWSLDPIENLRILANSRNDTIKQPAESCRNISVASVNPAHIDGITALGLSNYSCRGPGLRSGLKPDLAHIGGAGTQHAVHGHGLYSIDPLGFITDGCGTSYAAPNIARIMASLENAIEGEVSRETLISLCIHNASLPEAMQDKKLNSIAKHLVGFGIPLSSSEILNGSENAITLVFSNRVRRGKRLSFKFSWPSCLVKNGKCTGKARLTIVSTPPLDYKYGTEFVRINIDARLRQMQNDGKYNGKLTAIYTPEAIDNGVSEKDRIEHSFKWSPVKVYEKEFKRGIGPTTDWSLDVEYLARDGEELPVSGVPFTVLLTISDPKQEEPVFNEMRQTLQSIGVQTVDIKTATRIVSRV